MSERPQLTIVAGPVPDGADDVVVTMANGAEQAAVLLESEGWQWFVVEVPQTDGVLRLAAFDADGEILERAELDLAGYQTDLGP